MNQQICESTQGAVQTLTLPSIVYTYLKSRIEMLRYFEQNSPWNSYFDKIYSEIQDLVKLDKDFFLFVLFSKKVQLDLSATPATIQTTTMNIRCPQCKHKLKKLSALTIQKYLKT